MFPRHMPNFTKRRVEESAEKLRFESLDAFGVEKLADSAYIMTRDTGLHSFGRERDLIGWREESGAILTAAAQGEERLFDAPIRRGTERGILQRHFAERQIDLISKNKSNAAVDLRQKLNVKLASRFMVRKWAWVFHVGVEQAVRIVVSIDPGQHGLRLFEEKNVAIQKQETL